MLYTNRAALQLFGNEQLQGECPSVLHTIYISSNPQLFGNEELRGELPSVLYTIYKSNYPANEQFVRQMNICEVKYRLYYILHANRATPQLFGNEQLRGELPSVLYTINKSSYPAVVWK